MKRLGGLLSSWLDPLVWLQVLRIAHFYGYSHVRQRRHLTTGRGVRIAPNVSFRNAERISVGDRSHLNEHSILWAGDGHGRIRIGSDVLIAPRCMISASNYGIDLGTPPVFQAKRERDIVIGDGAWLGAHVIVTAGVTIGAGAVIGAGSVVTKDVPPGVVAAGVPARVIGPRPEPTT